MARRIPLSYLSLFRKHMELGCQCQLLNSRTHDNLQTMIQMKGMLGPKLLKTISHPQKQLTLLCSVLENMVHESWASREPITVHT